MTDTTQERERGTVKVYSQEEVDELLSSARRLALEEALSVLPEDKELESYKNKGGIENQLLSQENNLKAGFNKGIRESRTAITRLLEKS